MTKGNTEPALIHKESCFELTHPTTHTNFLSDSQALFHQPTSKIVEAWVDFQVTKYSDLISVRRNIKIREPSDGPAGQIVDCLLLVSFCEDDEQHCVPVSCKVNAQRVFSGQMNEVCQERNEEREITKAVTYVSFGFAFLRENRDGCVIQLIRSREFNGWFSNMTVLLKGEEKVRHTGLYVKDLPKIGKINLLTVREEDEDEKKPKKKKKTQKKGTQKATKKQKKKEPVGKRSIDQVNDDDDDGESHKKTKHHHTVTTSSGRILCQLPKPPNLSNTAGSYTGYDTIHDMFHYDTFSSLPSAVVETVGVETDHSAQDKETQELINDMNEHWNQEPISPTWDFMEQLYETTIRPYEKEAEEQVDCLQTGNELPFSADNGIALNPYVAADQYEKQCVMNSECSTQLFYAPHNEFTCWFMPCELCRFYNTWINHIYSY